MSEENTHNFKELAENEIDKNSADTTQEGGDQFSEMSTPSGLGTVPKWQWAVLVILVIAIVVVLLWYFLKPKNTTSIIQPEANNIVSQIDQVPENNSVVDQIVNPTSTDQIIDDTKIDTDQDGLSDVEELTIWLTDPTLADTDADGYSDGEEVKNGYNPRGEGSLDSTLYNFSTIQQTLNTLAKAFNTNDLDLWMSTLSESNPEYQLLLLEGQSNLDFMVTYYENKTVSFVVTQQIELEENRFEVQADVLLDNQSFESSIFIFTQENEQWKILE